MILAGRCFTVTDHDDDDVRRRIKDDVPCLHAIAIAPLPFRRRHWCLSIITLHRFHIVGRRRRLSSLS